MHLSPEKHLAIFFPFKDYRESDFSGRCNFSFTGKLLKIQKQTTEIFCGLLLQRIRTKNQDSQLFISAQTLRKVSIAERLPV